ncbi:MAG: DUF1848 domain-containing protein [Treponema sp.]|jgi:hypothetical protein|nr:DUF1848 domain-containing protein [Treponema sp.]
MIISANRRTDIPAHYSDWFINRIKERYVCARNPMNIHQISNINLNPDVVDCIVFWTKNLHPILDKLQFLKDYVENSFSRHDPVLPLLIGKVNDNDIVNDWSGLFTLWGLTPLSYLLWLGHSALQLGSGSFALSVGATVNRTVSIMQAVKDRIQLLLCQKSPAVRTCSAVRRPRRQKS